MLHGTALKAVIWCLTIIGLAPAIVLALVAFGFELLAGPSSAASPEAAPVHRSNEWLQIGPIRIDDWHPRAWAATVLALGVVSIVIALFVLLHVPRAT